MPRRPNRRVPFARPFTRDDLAASGYSYAELRGWLSRGEVVRLSHGVYLEAGLDDLTAQRAITPHPKVVAGASPVPLLGAANIHRIPLPPDAQRRLERADARRVIPDDCLERRPNGLLVPTLAWTALQVARDQTLPGALIPLDHALARGIERDELTALADAMRTWPGCRHLARAIAAASELSESPLESWSRGLMIDAGLPAPVLQHVLHADGVTMRCDFAFLEEGVIGEADGLGKYGTGDAAAQSIAQEKRRQARLQALGFVVYRWGWKDVHPSPEAWLAGLRRALDVRRRRPA